MVGVKEARWEAPQTISGLIIIVDTLFPWTLKFSEPYVLWGGNIKFFYRPVFTFQSLYSQTKGTGSEGSGKCM